MTPAEKAAHARRMLDHGTRVSRSDLARMRSQAERHAMSDQPDWRKIAQALAELEERRRNDPKEMT